MSLLSLILLFLVTHCWFTLKFQLPPRTIQIRDSMIKVEIDPDLVNFETENSLELVGTRYPTFYFLFPYFAFGMLLELNANFLLICITYIPREKWNAQLLFLMKVS